MVFLLRDVLPVYVRAFCPFALVQYYGYLASYYESYIEYNILYTLYKLKRE